jgi:hypothetical protein
MLSRAGKEILIKAIAQAIRENCIFGTPNIALRSFAISNIVLAKIEL